MNVLDFLANSPNTFIFRKERNKTHFGGILFLIFIIIMVFITVVYLITFIKNDKYEIEYKAILKNGRKDLMDLLKEEGDIYNPLMDLTIKFSGFK